MAFSIYCFWNTCINLMPSIRFPIHNSIRTPLSVIRMRPRRRLAHIIIPALNPLLPYHHRPLMCHHNPIHRNMLAAMALHGRARRVDVGLDVGRPVTAGGRGLLVVARQHGLGADVGPVLAAAAAVLRGSRARAVGVGGVGAFAAVAAAGGLAGAVAGGDPVEDEDGEENC